MLRAVHLIEATLILLLLYSQTFTHIKNMEPELFFSGSALQMAKAIQRDDIILINRLIGSVEVNRFYKHNMTFLIWAIIHDKERSFRELLKLGADPNMKDDENLQIVAFAASVSDNNNYLKILLTNGGDPNSLYKGEPTLHDAFDREYFKNVDIILNAGGDINSRNSEGLTILNAAGYRNWFDKAIELINRGADITIPTKNGGSIALQVQENKTYVGSETYNQQAELKRILVDKGVKFPILHPSAKKYIPLLAQWHQTSEGYRWQQRLQAIADDPLGFGKVWVETDDAAFEAFKNWMRTNNIPEPPQPE